MKRITIIQPLLTIGAAVFLLLAGCKKNNTDSSNNGAGGGSGNGSGGGGGTTVTYKNHIAFIYKKDSADGVAFKTLLQANNCGVTLFDSAQVVLGDFTKFDLIVIGTNSGRSASEFTYQMTGSVKAANKPLLMIGEGGGHFGEAIGSTVSWASTGNFSSTIMTVLDSTLSLFKAPKQIAVSGTMQLTVYNPGAGGQAFYKSPYISYPTVQTLIQAQTNSVQYFSVTYESGKYGYFGYYDNVNAMTSTGKDFMVNLCYYIGKLSQ